VSEIAFAGAVEVGLIFSFVALGVFLSFRVLDFPDLTTDGSFPLGAAVCATLITSGCNPWIATAVAMAGGMAAGLLTGLMTLRFRILGLLAGILTMTALYSINLRVMGRPNIALLNEPVIFSVGEHMGMPYPWTNTAVLAMLVCVAVAGLAWFLATDVGLAMRATGVNARMARAQGVNTAAMTYLGLALSNGLIAVGGALFAQANGFADVTSGIGTIVVGLASVILGEKFIRSRRMAALLFGTVLGSVAYRVAVQAALSGDGAGLRPSDLSLITAVMVAVAMVVPHVRLKRRIGVPA